jgi:adenine deaminase
VSGQGGGASRRSDLRALAAVPLGERPPDLVVQGAALLDVHSGQVLDGWGVAVVGDQIAAVGPDVARLASRMTRVLTLPGRILIPGLIDGHTHLDLILPLPEAIRGAVVHGTTTIVTETTSLASAGGAGAVEAFLEGLAALPIRVLATAPMISYLCSDAGGRPAISLVELRRILRRPGVIGLGETYWPFLLGGRRDVAALVAEARRLGKTIEGHGSGLRGRKLDGFLAAGATSCHESIGLEDVLERLRRGLHTMVREGSVRTDVGCLAGFDWARADAWNLSLVSDGVWPRELRAWGHMDGIVGRAVRAGVPPVRAIQMASIHPARYFGIAGLAGSLAPGRSADLVATPALDPISPELVMARGRIVAEAGRPAVAPARFGYGPGARRSLRAPRPFRPEDFQVAAPRRSAATVRVIEVVAPIVTREGRARLAPRGEALEPETGKDLCLVCAMDRRAPLRRAVGFVHGFGLARGALATSVTFDTMNLVCVGADRAAMATAMNRLVARGGGLVAAAGGTVVAEVPLPIWGAIGAAPTEALARGLDAFDEAARGLGCRLDAPMLTLMAQTFTVIPALRIRERGLVEVRTGRLVPLLVSDEREDGPPRPSAG